MGDEQTWEVVKKHIRKLRRKYLRFKEKVLDRLNASNVRVISRTRKPSTMQTANTITNADDPMTNPDELDYSSDINDPFEDEDDHRTVCHRIDWNVLHNHSNVFLLTTYLNGEKVICSISDIVPDYRYPHLCEIGQSAFDEFQCTLHRCFTFCSCFKLVLDFCFANVLCGTHGRCVNTLNGFTCACTFFFDGTFCQRCMLMD